MTTAITRRSPWPWIALALVIVSTIYGISGAVRDATSALEFLNQAAFAGLPILFAGLGVLIATRLPGNRIGWLIIAIAVGMSGGFIDSAVAAIDTAPASLTPGLFLLLSANNIGWIAFVFPTFLLLYIFPTGRLLSPRWRWAPGLLILLTGVLSAGSIFLTEVGPSDGRWQMPNPIGFIAPETVNQIMPPWVVSLLVLVAGGVTAMVIRYRRSQHVERAQIKLVRVSVVFFAVAYGIFALNTAGIDSASPMALLLPIGFGGIPVAITMAVLKHGLYGIDVVISRSITYGSLAVFIGAVYVGIVVGIGGLVVQGEGANPVLSIVATALVAFAFQPVRRRVEKLANRLVYGKRATPYEVLARFSRRASAMSDEELLDQIPRLVVDGTGAAHAAIWVRSGSRYRTASAWPDAALSRSIDRTDEFDDPDADYSTPVYHDGECLGGISLKKAAGDVTKPAEVDLLENLAGGMGLALRNTLLTERLRQQVRNLKRSRDRVVKAADDARRALEQDLDSGPQQQLVAIKVKLGPTRKLAEQEGATKTAGVLEAIEQQAGDAIQAVRDFSSGVYPPLLEAEGLAVALNHRMRDAAIPVVIDHDGLGRYPRAIESAVYFAILEALQNAAKYAGAATAHVELADEDGTLRFSVTDQGHGFDTGAVAPGAGLNGIADRLDAVGGSWNIASTPGSGTTVSGSVPVRDVIHT